MKVFISGFFEFLNDKMSRVLIGLELCGLILFLFQDKVGIVFTSNKFDSFLALSCIPFCLIGSCIIYGCLKCIQNKSS